MKELDVMNIITIKKEDDLFPMALKAIGDDCPNVIYATTILLPKFLCS